MKNKTIRDRKVSDLINKLSTFSQMDIKYEDLFDNVILHTIKDLLDYPDSIPLIMDDVEDTGEFSSLLWTSFQIKMKDIFDSMIPLITETGDQLNESLLTATSKILESDEKIKKQRKRFITNRRDVLSFVSNISIHSEENFNLMDHLEYHDSEQQYDNTYNIIENIIFPQTSTINPDDVEEIEYEITNIEIVGPDGSNESLLPLTADIYSLTDSEIFKSGWSIGEFFNTKKYGKPNMAILDKIKSGQFDNYTKTKELKIPILSAINNNKLDQDNHNIYWYQFQRPSGGQYMTLDVYINIYTASNNIIIKNETNTIDGISMHTTEGVVKIPPTISGDHLSDTTIKMYNIPLQSFEKVNGKRTARLQLSFITNKHELLKYTRMIRKVHSTITTEYNILETLCILTYVMTQFRKQRPGLNQLMQLGHGTGRYLFEYCFHDKVESTLNKYTALAERLIKEIEPDILKDTKTLDFLQRGVISGIISSALKTRRMNNIQEKIISQLHEKEGDIYCTPISIKNIDISSYPIDLDIHEYVSPEFTTTDEIAAIEIDINMTVPYLIDADDFRFIKTEISSDGIDWIQIRPKNGNQDLYDQSMPMRIIYNDNMDDNHFSSIYKTDRRKSVFLKITMFKHKPTGAVPIIKNYNIRVKTIGDK